MEWFEETPEGVILHIKVQPKASINKVVGLHGDPPRLKIRVAAAPVDGKANKELLEFLSKILEVSPSKIKLIRGATSPKKDILCTGVSLDKIMSLAHDWSQLSFHK